MFSQLGPLFKTTFRHAESNDTRQAIPHDERDKGRRKREEEEQKDSNASDLWEDNMTVTVGALRTFLINFLKTLPGAEDSAIAQQNPAEKISIRPKERKRPTSTKNARAVRAYQSMAEKAQESAPAPPPEKTSDRIEPTADLLESKELRDIHTLIDDLDNLAQKGVHDLQILKADSFLESLKNAVLAEKSKI